MLRTHISLLPLKIRTTHHELSNSHLSVFARRSRSNPVLELFYAFMDCVVAKAPRKDAKSASPDISGIFCVIFLILTMLLPGCASKRGRAPTQATRYHQRADSAPSKLQVPKNIQKIPDAVPQVEPKSKYGNPPSYVVFSKKYHVLSSSTGYKSSGMASWYGTKFHGYRTSSGELYDMYKMTAAHKTLPLPTYVQVKNLDNGKKVIVKVNDRGPFHSNRLLDLSYAAAAKLDILRKGTGRIEVTAIDPRKLSPKNYILAKKQPKQKAIAKQNVQRERTLALNKANTATPSKKSTPIATSINTNNESSTIYRYLQVGAFNNKANAESLRKKILQLSGPNLQVHIQTSSNNNASIFRVRIGPIDNHGLLTKIKNKIVQAKLPIPISIP